MNQANSHIRQRSVHDGKNRDEKAQRDSQPVSQPVGQTKNKKTKKTKTPASQLPTQPTVGQI